MTTTSLFIDAFAPILLRFSSPSSKRLILREGDLNPHIRVYETRELPLLYPAICKGNNLLQGTSEGQVTSLILSFRARWYLGCDPLFPLVDKYYRTNQELLSNNIFREH